MRQELYQKLEQYEKEGIYPFHMPGHKRNPLFAPWEGSGFSMDITEIHGFDNLHHPEGLIREAQERAARLYQVRETFFCVNGSTAALLAAISASCRRGGRILMARNCHKAVYHGAALRQLQVSYLYPETEGTFRLNGGITPDMVREALQREPGTEAVLLTSPTYDGVVSDIAGIADVVHRAGCILIVDEAHGAHLKFHPWFPEPAAAGGADLVIQSLHKTMPSLTQTALLHRNSSRVSHDSLQQYLGIYQTSSPSYLLMASMDACICRMFVRGAEEFQAYAERLKALREELSSLRHIRLAGRELKGRAGIFDCDPSKLVLSVRGTALSGSRFSGILREKYRLEMEMEAVDYVLALTSVCDTDEGFARLARALREIDAWIGENGLSAKPSSREMFRERLAQEMRLSDAMEARKSRCALSLSAGRISGEFVYLYPPGTPVLVPGERITGECAEAISALREEGLQVQGLSDYSGQSICVVEE